MLNYDLRSARKRRQAFHLGYLVVFAVTALAAYLHVGGALEAWLGPAPAFRTIDAAMPWAFRLLVPVAFGLVFRAWTVTAYLVWVLSSPLAWTEPKAAKLILGLVRDGLEPSSSVLMTAAAGALTLMLVFVEYWWRSGALPRTSDRHGSARFATLADLRKRTELLSGKGLPLARFGRRTLRDPSEYSVLVLAPTGAGKTSGTLIPAALEHPGSLVALDPKNAEIFERTSGFRRSQGQRVVHLHSENPTDAINPLDLIPRGEDLVTYANLTAGLLVNPQGRDLASHEEFWVESARALLGALIAVALEREDAPHLGSVAKMLHQHDLMGFLRNCAADGAIPPYAQQVATGLIQLDERPFTSIIATARRATDLYLDPLVLRMVGRSTVDLAQLRREPTSLYISLRPNRATLYQPLLRLLLTLTLHRLTEAEPTEEDLPILMVIDELPLLRRFTYLETALGYARSYKIRLLMAAQNLQQIYGLYGRHAEILNHCRTQIHYPPTDHESAKLLSELVGRRTIATDSTSRNHSGIRTSRSATANETARPLLAPDEIRRLDPHRPILLHPGVHPVLAEWSPWFRDARLRKMVETEG